MHQSDHEQKTLELYGDPWTALHLWIDQYFADYSVTHRRMLHHKLGVELAVKQFGEGARGPAEQHIRDDLGGELPENWAWYGIPMWDSLDDFFRQRAELRRLYGETVYQEIADKPLARNS